MIMRVMKKMKYKKYMESFLSLKMLMQVIMSLHRCGIRIHS